MSILGNRVLRKEDPAFLTVGARYLDDLDLPGAAYVTYVRSTMAHALLAGVDASEAATMPGVLGVFTGADVDLAPFSTFGQGMGWPGLAVDRVRFVGEAVAAIVAETRAQGVDAAEMVVVDYDPLPVVLDPETALTSEVLLFPEIGTNVSMSLDFPVAGDFFDGCEVVARLRTVNQRVAPAPLEVRAGASRWEADGRLTFWASTQSAHLVRDFLSQSYGIDVEQVHVVTPDVGGGFGAKMYPTPEELLLPWLARQVGGPVRWVETRSENLVAMGHGRGQVQDVEIGGTRDGRVLAYRLSIVQDAGAYPTVGSALPWMTRLMTTGVYDIPKAECSSRSVLTNTTPVTAYRGAGRPEATAAIERAIDVFAAEIGMDPAEVRRRNVVPKDAFPYTTPVGTTYDSGDYERALDLVLEAAGYDELRAEQARRRQAGDTRQMGIGLSVYVEITNAMPGGEYARVEVLPDGKARVFTGTSPHGQGHATSWAMLVSDQMGIAVDDIDVVHGDTDLVPRGGGTGGSRSLQVGGVAVRRAAVEMVERGKDLAARLLEAAPEDLVLDRVGGRFHVAGTPAVARSWAELAAAEPGELVVEVDFTPPGPTFPFGAHLVVVEVDTETGKVEVRRVVAVDDAGRLLNPLLAEGQVHGGLAQGVAQALMEEVRYDEDGNPVTSNLADYAFVSACEVPSFETVHMETPTPNNELGAKGIGESGTIGSTPAVQNAVVDALSPYGVRHLDMPFTPEKVWRAITGA